VLLFRSTVGVEGASIPCSSEGESKPNSVNRREYWVVVAQGRVRTVEVVVEVVVGWDKISCLEEEYSTPVMILESSTAGLSGRCEWALRSGG
jgi:hypothetical protein